MWDLGSIDTIVASMITNAGRGRRCCTLDNRSLVIIAQIPVTCLSVSPSSLSLFQTLVSITVVFTVFGEDFLIDREQSLSNTVLQ